VSTQTPKKPGMVTIRYIIMSLLNRLGQYDLKSYKRLCQIAIEGFTEEFSLFHIGHSLETIYLHMSAAKTIPLPADYVDFTKIGFPVNGKLRVITRNDNILLPRTWDDGDGSAIGNFYGAAIGEEALGTVIFFGEHFKNGQYIGGLYGLPGGIDDCYYRVDMENRQIVFSGSTPRSEIILEYIGTSLKPDGSSLIPRQVVAPLRAYVLWQMIVNDTRVAANEKDRRERAFNEATEALRSFSNSFTASEYLSMLYSTVHQSVKR
jgi:hypothetical protein